MLRVVTDRFDYAETLGATLAEKKPVTWGKILRALNEAECDRCTVSGTDELSVDVDDGTGLRDRTNVEHSLVFGLDGSGVREDEDLESVSFKFVVVSEDRLIILTYLPR